MRALTWHGKRDVRVEEVPDPTVQESTDAVVRITSTAICGSDLHLYELFGPFMDPGDVLGHEPMGIVEAVGPDVAHIEPGDRVVIPFNISCGWCFMCTNGLHSQCETTQVHEHGTGAALFGYTKLDDLMPLVLDEHDPLGLSDFVTHRVPLESAPDAYKMFHAKKDGAIKVVLTP